MCNMERGTIEYSQPVNIQDTSNYHTVSVLVVMYNGDGVNSNKFIYPCATKLIKFNIVSVIMKISLFLDDNLNNAYTLDSDDQLKLDMFCYQYCSFPHVQPRAWQLIRQLVQKELQGKTWRRIIGLWASTKLHLHQGKGPQHVGENRSFMTIR